MQRGSGFNPNRRIGERSRHPAAHWAQLSRQARYGGNAQHKSRPADYELDPPTAPRPGASLCDGDAPFPRMDAVRLLRAGLRKGMVSVQMRGDWPQNIWSVRNGMPYEAQLDNRDQGSYHGYPMQENDDFRDRVLEEWAQR